MGGRGASSGITDSGKRYGTEFRTIAQAGNVKFIKNNDGSVTAPMDTRTRGRIYATLDKYNDVKHITFYDVNGERYKQIDVKGPKHIGKLPHNHLGYEHDEYGTRELSQKEQRKVNEILTIWSRRRKKLNI